MKRLPGQTARREERCSSGSRPSCLTQIYQGDQPNDAPHRQVWPLVSRVWTSRRPRSLTGVLRHRAGDGVPGTSPDGCWIGRAFSNLLRPTPKRPASLIATGWFRQVPLRWIGAAGSFRDIREFPPSFQSGGSSLSVCRPRTSLHTGLRIAPRRRRTPCLRF